MKGKEKARGGKERLNEVDMRRESERIVRNTRMQMVTILLSPMMVVILKPY